MDKGESLFNKGKLESRTLIKRAQKGKQRVGLDIKIEFPSFSTQYRNGTFFINRAVPFTVFRDKWKEWATNNMTHEDCKKIQFSIKAM